MTTTAQQTAEAVESIADERELPEGWTTAPLEQCVEVLDGKRVPVNSEERQKRVGTIPYYGATGQVGWIDKFLFNEELLLLGEDGAPFLEKGKPIAYVIAGKSWVNNHAHVLRAVKGLTSNQFLKYFLDLFDFSEYVTGSTRLKLTQGAMNKIPVLLAPFPEQARVVSKIQRLLVPVQGVQQRLKENLPKVLTRFRQAVLAAACSGRLTADWREAHPEIELSSELEQRFRNDRKAEWTTRELLRMQSRGTHRSDDKWRGKYLEPVNPDSTEDAPDLPDTWCATGIELLLSLKRRGMKTGPFGSSLKKSEHQEMGIPVLGIENIGEMKFIEGSKIHISQSKADELCEFDARPGDILISRSGTVGEVCVVPNGLGEARISTNIMRLTLRDSGMLPTLFCYLFNGSPFVLRQVAQLCGGSTRDFLNQTILLSILFPVPPIQEQREIVRRVEALFKLADAIDKRLAAASLRAERLTQAILAKAFRGELVPTEAELARREGREYEHASVLLERIRADREKGVQTQPKREKKTRVARKSN
jgi:type I restriction enzyme S subunit